MEKAIKVILTVLFVACALPVAKILITFMLGVLGITALVPGVMIPVLLVVVCFAWVDYIIIRSVIRLFWR